MTENTNGLTNGLTRSLGSVLSVRRGEGKKTALLFAHLLTASSIFILGRTVRDTLFLSRYELSALPWMFVLYGVASALTVVVYAQVADKLSRSVFIAISCGIGAITYLATYAAVKAEMLWIYPVFYVWSEVAANLFIVQFWTYANDLNDPRSARRLFPTIAAARVLGVVLIGLAAGSVVQLIGTEQLLLVLVGLMGIVVLLARSLRRFEAPAPTAAPEQRVVRRAPRVTRDPYVRALSLFLLLAFVALTIGDYQFKAIARATFQEDELARYFSLFYAGTGILSFFFQVFITPRILRRLGVGWGMGIMPGVFGAATVGLVFAPFLPLATVMKFADNGFQYTVHETTLQALYVPFPDRAKAQTRAFLDAVIKPMSYGAGGLVLVALAPRLDVVELSLVVVGIVAVWLLTIPWVRRRYVTALKNTLGLHGALETESIGELASEARSALQQVLERGDSRVAAAALSQVTGALPKDLIQPVETLALHGDVFLRRAALTALAGTEGVSAAPVYAAAESSDPKLRAAAAEASGPILGDGCVEPLAGLLADSHKRVRANALIGLFTYGGAEGAIIGGRRLAGLLDSTRVGDRVEACRVLGELGTAGFRPVRDLLADPEPKVRSAALRAAKHVGDPRLVPRLVEALVVPSTRALAGAALVSAGPAAAPALLELLDDAATTRDLQLVLPRLLRRVPCEAAFSGLSAHLDHPDGHVRLRVTTALASIRKRLDAPPMEADALHAHLEAELTRGYHRLGAWHRAKETFDTELLGFAHHCYARRTGKRLLRLLSLRYDKGSLDLVRKGLAVATRRGNALELLDGMLEPSQRALVMPWFDDSPVEQRLARAGELAPELVEPLNYMEECASHPNPYLRSLALESLARHPCPEGRAIAERALEDPDPLVREMARVALDPTPSPARGTMYTTLEKVLLLKSAMVFEKVDAEDLAPMAQAAEELSFDAGETIIEEGEMGDVLYLVNSGRVEVLRGGTTLATLGAGETFGEMAVLDAEPRSATVRAEVATSCLAIASEDFYDVLREQVEIAEGVIRMLTHRLRGADDVADPVSMVPPSPEP